MTCAIIGEAGAFEMVKGVVDYFVAVSVQTR
jgi:hypothetical protein